MSKSVWLYVSGDEYSAQEFIENYNVEDFYSKMVAEGVNLEVIDEEEFYMEVEIKDFGDVDDSFVRFIKDNLCDYDSLKSCDIFRVDLDKISDEKKDEYEGMEIGNMFFGNSRGKYSVTSERKEDMIFDLIKSCNGDEYGIFEDSNPGYNKLTDGFKNDVFEINPYYWGLDDNIKVIPNFKHHKTGYELKWYKYPLRDSYANMDLTDLEFEKIIEDCKDSLKKEA